MADQTGSNIPIKSRVVNVHPEPSWNTIPIIFKESNMWLSIRLNDTGEFVATAMISKDYTAVDGSKHTVVTPLAIELSNEVKKSLSDVLTKASEELNKICAHNEIEHMAAVNTDIRKKAAAKKAEEKVKESTIKFDEKSSASGV